MPPKQKSQSQKKKERALANQRANNPDAGKPQFAPKSTKPAKVAPQTAANHHLRVRHFANNSEDAWENDPELWDIYQEGCKAINRPEEMEDVDSDDEGSGTEKLRMALKKQEEKDHREAVEKLIQQGVLKVDEDEMIRNNEKIVIANKAGDPRKDDETHKDSLSTCSHKADEIAQKGIDISKDTKGDLQPKQNSIAEAFEKHHHQNENAVTKVANIGNNGNITTYNEEKNDSPRGNPPLSNKGCKTEDDHQLKGRLAHKEHQSEVQEISIHHEIPGVDDMSMEHKKAARSVDHIIKVTDLVKDNCLSENVKNTAPVPSSFKVASQARILADSTTHLDALSGMEDRDSSQSRTWRRAVTGKDNKQQASSSPDTLLSVITEPTQPKKVSPVAMVVSRIIQQTIQDNNASNVSLPALNVLKEDTDLKDDDQRAPTPLPRLNRKHSRLRSPNGQHALDLEDKSWRSAPKESATNSRDVSNDRNDHKKESKQWWRQQAHIQGQQDLNIPKGKVPAWKPSNVQTKAQDDQRVSLDVKKNLNSHGVLNLGSKPVCGTKEDDSKQFSAVDENASKRCTIFYCATKDVRRVLEPSKETVTSSSSHGRFKIKRCICGKALGAIMNRDVVLHSIQGNNNGNLGANGKIILAHRLSRIEQAKTPSVMKPEVNQVPPVARAAFALRGRSQSLIAPQAKPKSSFLSRPTPLRTQTTLMGAAAKYPRQKIRPRRHTTCQPVSETRISPPLLHTSDGEDELSDWEPVTNPNPPPFRDYTLPSPPVLTRNYELPASAWIPIILITPSSDDETDGYKHNLAPLTALQQEPSRLIEPKRISKPGRAKQIQARKMKISKLEQQVRELQTLLDASQTVLPASDAESGVEAEKRRLERVLMMTEESKVAAPKAPKTPSLIRKLAVSKPAPPVITKMGTSLELAFKPKARPERKQVFVWEALE